MKALIAFQEGNKACMQVAEEIKKVFQKNGLEIVLQAVQPKEEMRLYEYMKIFRKKKRLELKPCITDVEEFDIIVIGTPVLKFGPTPIMESYVRMLENVKNKKFALYCTPVGFSGTTLKKLSGILRTKGAKVIAAISISSIFELNERKLKEAAEFAREILEELKSANNSLKGSYVGK